MTLRRKNLCAVILACSLTGCATPKPAVTVFELVSRAPAQLTAREECVVKSVMPGSPAAQGGIRAGDALTGLNRDTAPAGDLNFEAFLSSRTGPFQVELTRQGKPLQLDIMHTEDLHPFGVTCDFGDIEASQDEAFVAIKGSLELLVRAEVIGPASFIWVRLQNRSTKPLKVSPDMFSASSADWTILNPIRFSDMVSSLQAMEVSGRFAGKGAESASYTFGVGDALSQIPNIIPIPGAGMGANFLLKNTGLTDMVNAQTSSVTSLPLGEENGLGPRFRGASKGLAATWIPSSGNVDSDLAVAANEIIRRKPFRETVLTPGYAQEGYLYFEQPDKLPLRLSLDAGEEHLALLFDEKKFTMTPRELAVYARGVPEFSHKQAVLADGQFFEGEIGAWDRMAHGFKTRIRKNGQEVKSKLLLKDIRILKVAGRNTILVAEPPKPAKPQ